MSNFIWLLVESFILNMNFYLFYVLTWCVRLDKFSIYIEIVRTGLFDRTGQVSIIEIPTRTIKARQTLEITVFVTSPSSVISLALKTGKEYSKQ